MGKVNWKDWNRPPLDWQESVVSRDSLMDLWREDLRRLGLTAEAPFYRYLAAHEPPSIRRPRQWRWDSRQILLRVVTRLQDRGWTWKALAHIWGSSPTALESLVCRARAERELQGRQ